MLARELHCTVISKDARTMIGSESPGICLITNGNSGMATAGSGDVLTGITAAVLAQADRAAEAVSNIKKRKDNAGVSASTAQTAAETAAWIHARAGGFAKQAKGERSMIAGDLIHWLTQVMRELE